MMPNCFAPGGPSEGGLSNFNGSMGICQVCVLCHGLRRGFDTSYESGCSYITRKRGACPFRSRICREVDWSHPTHDVSNVLPQFHGRSCTTQVPETTLALQSASSSKPRAETWRPREYESCHGMQHRVANDMLANCLWPCNWCDPGG
jgi:hypothetical protein